MNSFNNKLQLALLNRKKGQKLLEKGFTLVELMIVIVIVGILSAVALPNFLGNRDRAQVQTLIKSANDFAKQCGTNMLTENPGDIIGIPADIVTLPAAVGGIISCGALDNATGVFTPTLHDFTVTVTPAQAENIEGLICGKDNTGQITADQRNDGIETICTITVDDGTTDPAGTVRGIWS